MGRGGGRRAAKGLGWLRPRSPDGAPTREAQGIHGRAPPSRGAPASGMETRPQGGRARRGRGTPGPAGVAGSSPHRLPPPVLPGRRAPSAGSQAVGEAAHGPAGVAAAVPASGGPPPLAPTCRRDTRAPPATRLRGSGSAASCSSKNRNSEHTWAHLSEFRCVGLPWWLSS